MMAAGHSYGLVGENDAIFKHTHTRILFTIRNGWHLIADVQRLESYFAVVLFSIVHFVLFALH